MIDHSVEQQPSHRPSTAALFLDDLLCLGSPPLLRSELTGLHPDINRADTNPDIADSAQRVVAFLQLTRRERQRSALSTVLSLPLTALLGPKCVGADIRRYREWSLISRDLDALTVAKYNLVVKMELACRSVAEHPPQDDTSHAMLPSHCDAERLGVDAREPSS